MKDDVERCREDLADVVAAVLGAVPGCEGEYRRRSAAGLLAGAVERLIEARLAAALARPGGGCGDERAGPIPEPGG